MKLDDHAQYVRRINELEKGATPEQMPYVVEAWKLIDVRRYSEASVELKKGLGINGAWNDWDVKCGVLTVLLREDGKRRISS